MMQTPLSLFLTNTQAEPFWKWMHSLCSHMSSSPHHFLVNIPQCFLGVATSSVLVSSVGIAAAGLVAVGVAMTMEKRVAMRMAMRSKNAILGWGWVKEQERYTREKGMRKCGGFTRLGTVIHYP